MFEMFVFVGSGLFALYSYYQTQEFKTKLQKKANAYCEEEISRIERSCEFKIITLKDEIHSANETIKKLGALKEKERVAKEVNVIEKALANFI